MFTQEEKELLQEALDLSINITSGSINKVPKEKREEVRELIQAHLNLSNKVANIEVK